ncbi:hypothetical protein BpHYR1_029715 [Brachionus plicatilis]|uniref:Uncharacterized protein n=1 Tax=Brachionus plicatilis TaxID=10195 RepID=A0A3M7PHH3_BRAPC|nr:hypothetical protein BpHYR1_029715 [Brachionus plicatilis]
MSNKIFMKIKLKNLTCETSSHVTVLKRKYSRNRNGNNQLTTCVFVPEHLFNLISRRNGSQHQMIFKSGKREKK